MNIIDKVKKIYNDDEMFLIGALDCFGVSHTPDNTEVKSYIDMIADDMTAYGLNINYVNLHSLGCNKTFSLKRIIDADYQKQEYYDINLVQTKKAIAKEGIFPFPVNPKFLTDYYKDINNPTVKIYMFGVYPMFESKLIRYSLAPIYAKINRKVASYFAEYDNIHFVDVMGNINHIAKNDCHPSFKGQCYMESRVINVIGK